jgi:hypothetical protein
MGPFLSCYIRRIRTNPNRDGLITGERKTRQLWSQFTKAPRDRQIRKKVPCFRFQASGVGSAASSLTPGTRHLAPDTFPELAPGSFTFVCSTTNFQRNLRVDCPGTVLNCAAVLNVSKKGEMRGGTCFAASPARLHAYLTQTEFEAYAEAPVEES